MNGEGAGTALLPLKRQSMAVSVRALPDGFPCGACVFICASDFSMPSTTSDES